jgi:anti-anti-sigma factor
VQIHSLRLTGHTLEVGLRGELDAACSAELSQTLDRMARLCAERGLSRLALDMSEVEFFDSSAVMVLLECRRQMARVGATLSIPRASRCVVRVLAILGLQSLFEGEAGSLLEEVQAARRHTDP